LQPQNENRNNRTTCELGLTLFAAHQLAVSH